MPGLSFSQWLVPLLLGAVPLLAAWRRVDAFAAFLEGAENGLRLSVSLAPYLVGIFVAVGVLRASGCLEALAGLLAPALAWTGVPVDVLPLVLLRPLSGSASFAYMAEVMERSGPDSPAGLLAALIQGGTETTVYVLALYFGSVGVTRIRHALAAGLLADLASFIGAVLAYHLFFGAAR